MDCPYSVMLDILLSVLFLHALLYWVACKIDLLINTTYGNPYNINCTLSRWGCHLQLIFKALHCLSSSKNTEVITPWKLSHLGKLEIRSPSTTLLTIIWFWDLITAGSSTSIWTLTAEKAGCTTTFHFFSLFISF